MQIEIAETIQHWNVAEFQPQRIEMAHQKIQTIETMRRPHNLKVRKGYSKVGLF